MTEPYTAAAFALDMSQAFALCVVVGAVVISGAYLVGAFLRGGRGR